MTSRLIRQKFLDFFKEKGHTIIPSASLIPEHDPTVLFTTAGMQPLIPYLLGEKHPGGKRLANVQKCIRTQDIDEVGDEMHDTFFEMLGNWSLGDYFKKEAIEWSYEFLTSRKWLGLDTNRLAISVFAGDKDAARDEEAAKIWQSVGIPKERIFYYGKKDNWWGPVGETGPCGPDTEIFYDVLGPGHEGRHEEPGGQEKNELGQKCHPGEGCGKWLEIWNNVFMQYNKKKDGTYESLKQQNVDTGMGLERTAMVMQGKNNIFDTDLFLPTMVKIRDLAKTPNLKAERVVADHIRTATFILGDDFGVVPSNLDRGYILRRLIRRAIRFGKTLGIENNFTVAIADQVIDVYSDVYPELDRNSKRIIEELNKEEEKFRKTLEMGLKEFDKATQKLTGTVDGKTAFILFSTYGFPIEMTKELAHEKGLKVDEEEFQKEFKKHQERSRLGAEQKFAGGLADTSVESTRYHTATHLLHQALRDVLGDHVEQRGSNITPERLRFDFTHPQKMTPEEIKKVEDILNQKIDQDLPVSWKEMTPEEAKAAGALGFFDEKYEDKVKVYSVGDYSKEICGGPHVEHVGQLKEGGRFKILKEEAVSAGIRRIKAVLSPSP